MSGEGRKAPEAGGVLCVTVRTTLQEDCLLRKSASQKQEGLRCFRCGSAHLAHVCPENWTGEAGSAPASSPDNQ